MADEYNISDKYKLLEEVCVEPFGSYYYAESTDSNKFLILLLTQQASVFARQNLVKLQDKIQDKLPLPDTNYANYHSRIWPVLEIIDPLSIEPDNTQTCISIVMPYLEGCSLSHAIGKLKKPLSLRKTLKLLHPLTKQISEEHKSGHFHGFINFSTIWLTKNNQLKLLGFDIFNIIFEKLEIKISEFYHPKISTCLSEDNQSAKITFSIASDYYSVLVIAYCLLNGSIPNTKNIIFSPILGINKKARKLLTAEHYRRVYQENITLEQWFGHLQATVKWPILENILAVLLIVSLTGVMAYQYKDELQATFVASAYNALKNKYQSALSYFNNHNNPINKLSVASGSIDKNSQNTATNIHSLDNAAVTKVTSLVTDLDVENNLYNYTAAENKDTQTPTQLPQSLKDDQLLMANAANAMALAAPSGAVPATKEVPSTSIKEMMDKADDGKTEGFVCAGQVCRETIVDLITGPKMIKVEMLNDKSWMMQSPLSRRDYYTYCYFVDDCKQKKDIANNNVLKCLFENSCTNETSLWLNYPINKLSIDDLNKYVAWLNKVTNGGYEILPDKFWPILAQKFPPAQHCVYVFNNPNDFIALNKPELVTVNKKIAKRLPPKFISENDNYGEPQCQTSLLTDNINSEQGDDLVRLIKKIT